MEIVLTTILVVLIGVVLRALDQDKRRYYYFCASCVLVGLVLVIVGVSIRVESVEKLTAASIVLKRLEANSNDRILSLSSTEGSFEMYDVDLHLLSSPTFVSDKGVEALVWKHPRNEGEIVGLRANQFDVSPEVWIRSNKATARQAIVGGFVFCFLGLLVGVINYSQRHGSQSD